MLAHAKAKTPDGHDIPLRLYNQVAGTTAWLATDTVPIPDSDAGGKLLVKLSPGLTGVSGPLGLANAYETTVDINRKLMATGINAVASTREQPSINITFNNGVDVPTLKKVLSIEPAIPFTMQSDAGDAVSLRGDFQAGTRYTVRIAEMPRGAAGIDRALAPRPGSLSVLMPDKEADIWFDNEQGYLSTEGNRTVMAHAVNIASVRVSLTRMYDNNLVVWRNYLDSPTWTATDSYSKPVASKTFTTAAAKNANFDLPIHLDDLLPPGTDRAGVWRVTISKADADTADADQADDGESRYRHRWSYDDSDRDSVVVTLSDIALTAKRTHDGLVAWATSLRSAQPLANVRVRAFSSKNQLLGEATTTADGLARLDNLHPEKDETVTVLLADFVAAPATQPTTESTTQPIIAPQLTWLDISRNHWELGDTDVSGEPYLRTGQRAYVYTDRGIYRPGETVHLRAIVRSAGTVAPDKTFPVKWQMIRPDLRDWKSQTVMLDSDGAASTDITLPTDVPSGQWSALISLPGGDEKKRESFGSVNFQVEDFIPNRLKVAVNLVNGQEKNPRRYSISETPLDVEVQGDYLFGRPGAGLVVEVINHAVPVAFAPTGWDQWTFGDTAGLSHIAKTSDGKTTKTSHRKHKGSGNATVAGAEEEPTGSALDEHGRYRTSLDVAGIVHFSEDDINAYHGPWLLTTQAGVREAGGRAVTIGKQITIDALPAYLAVRRSDGHAYAQPGQNAEFQIKAVKPDGAPASDSDATVKLQLLKETWNTVMVHRDGHYQYESTRVLDPIAVQSLQLSEGAGSWSVMIQNSGEYVLAVRDPNTGAMTSFPFYATDGSGWEENVDRQNPDRLQVRLLGAGEDENASTTGKSSAQQWHIGETARVLVAAPFAGRLLLNVETDDVIQSQVVDMPTSHVVVPVTVPAGAWPNAFISATVVRAIDPNAKWQSHRAFGVTRLPIDVTSRQLQITLDAPEMIRPLQSLDVGVKVTDSDGNPVENAAINLAAVDEGICSLTDFKTPDPLKFFSSKRALGVESSDLFGLLMPEVARPDGQREIGGDKPEADLGGRYRSPVGARRVKPVALAWTNVRTDATGFARGSFPLPQFQGKLRIVAVGYTPILLGSADRGVTVRSPVLAQSSWPRFAAPGDKFSVPVVIFNNTVAGGDAQVSMRLLHDERTPAGLLGMGSELAPMQELAPVAIAAGGQAQVSFDVTAAQAVGVARVALTVVMGNETFEEETELPVRPASPMTQTGGVAAASTTQPSAITSLASMMPGTGALNVNLTPWPTLNLPKGLEYLDSYPYGCVEQTTSTCFPLIALGDIGKTIDPVRFNKQSIHDKVDAGITRLIGMQCADGGLSMWQGETTDWAWGSVYACHFLTVAKSAGYEVPAQFYDHLLAYVHRLMEQGSDDASQLELQSYAAYVLALAGKPDRATMDRLTELSQAEARLDDPADGYCMRGDARLMLSNAWLLSGRRDLAEGLMPDAIPSPRLIRHFDGNLGSPIRDRALLILTMEQVQPNRADLPELVQQLADQGLKNEWASTQDVAFSVLAIGKYLQAFKGKTPYETARLLAGNAVLASASNGGSFTWSGQAPRDPLRVELTGASDAAGYLSWLQTGVPLTPPADAEHGLKVHRHYTTLDGEELKGTIHTGDLLRVELTIEAPPDQANLVIEDLLPAGLEVENPKLETAAKDSTGNDDPAHFDTALVSMRDDRVIIAGSMPSLWKAHCSYLARAITPGTYTVPPVRAEAMYDLNTNAISGTGKLVVLPVVKDVAAAD